MGIDPKKLDAIFKQHVGCEYEHVTPEVQSERFYRSNRSAHDLTMNKDDATFNVAILCIN